VYYDPTPLKKWRPALVPGYPGIRYLPITYEGCGSPVLNTDTPECCKNIVHADDDLVGDPGADSAE
jgi:hypothetical protein